MLNIKFDVHFKTDLGFIFKERDILASGLEAKAELDLSNVAHMYANFKISNIIDFINYPEYYSDDVNVVNVEQGIIQIPFKSSVLKIGKHEFEVVAVTVDGNVISSKTYIYSVAESLENEDAINGDTNYPLLVRLIEDVEEAVKDVEEAVKDTNEALESVNAALKEQDGFIDRLSDLESTFNELIINAGNSNSEIVDARVKSDGTSYSKLGDRLDEVDSQLEHIENQVDTIIDVVSLGIKEGLNNAQSNTDILYSLINEYPYGERSFYFKRGTYYFNPIYITDIVGEIKIRLLGSDNKSPNTWFKGVCTTINTNGNDFIIDKRTEGSIIFYANDLQFTSGIELGGIPVGICFGNSNESECNFKFNNVRIDGFDYGFKSNGWVCGGSGGSDISIGNCHCGIYSPKAAHLFKIDGLELRYNVNGLVFETAGGSPTKIANIHIANGYFGEDRDNYDKFSAIYTEGSLEINGIYHECYSDGAQPEKQIIIDYNAHGYGSSGVDIHDSNINSTDIYAFVRGKVKRTYFQDLTHYPAKHVKFINCTYNMKTLNDSLKFFTSTSDYSTSTKNLIGCSLNNKRICSHGIVIDENPIYKLQTTLDKPLFEKFTGFTFNVTGEVYRMSFSSANLINCIDEYGYYPDDNYYVSYIHPNVSNTGICKPEGKIIFKGNIVVKNIEANEKICLFLYDSASGYIRGIYKEVIDLSKHSNTTEVITINEEVDISTLKQLNSTGLMFGYLTANENSLSEDLLSNIYINIEYGTVFETYSNLS